MSNTQKHLFRQIVADTQKLLRLELLVSQGKREIQPQIDELRRGLVLKQALLKGLTDTSSNP